ncbi:MAG: HAMP domain-containing histidine kinase [Ruminiclostridium sp.]|nr:HAMP domain-containing histidine kinase [Ruminiclostridium sp.]
MSKLINQMLYLSKDDREETKLLMSEFNASEAIEGVCLATEALAFENGHTLVTEIEPDISCKGDREMIERLANILIDNAVRHSVGGEEVKVELHRKKNRNILTVSNRGEYIPQEELSHLFDRFYRTDKSRTSATGGFGLGLSIARAIADKHNGTLTAASSPDGLTTFTFTWRD